MTELLQKLGDHLKSHDQAAANEMMCDFIANRLPPYLKDGKAGETKGKVSNCSTNSCLSSEYFGESLVHLQPMVAD